MQAFSYDPRNGELIDVINVLENPRRPGEYMMPPNTTLEVPPIPVAGQAIVWDGSQWSHQTDLRGTKYFIGYEVNYITEIGEVPPVNSSPIHPDGEGMEDPAKSGNGTPSQEALTVNKHRANLILDGVDIILTAAVYDSQGAEITPERSVYVQGDQTTQINLLGLVQAANMRLQLGDTTHLTPYRDGNNVVHMLTPHEIIRVWSEGADYVSRIYQASWTIKAELPLTEDEIIAHSAWPANVIDLS